MTYDYRKPSRLNLVSLLLIVATIVGVYVAVKFFPVWWQARQVDEELDGYAIQAVDFGRYGADVREKDGERIVNQAIAALHKLGLEDQVDQPIEVWFSSEWDELHARYEVIVTHNLAGLLKPTVMRMHRVRKVPH